MSVLEDGAVAESVVDTEVEEQESPQQGQQVATQEEQGKAAEAAEQKPAEATSLDADWRKQIAGEDEKWLKQLNRYQSPKAMAEALREAQTKISQGQAKTLSEDPTDEQLAEWRQANGIPEAPDKYDLTLEDGLVIGDDDQPIVDEYLKAMHGTNATEAQVKAGLNAYFAARQQEIAAVEEKDNGDRESALQLLRDEWGPDFQSNRNALSSLINQVPEEARDLFMNARLADGTALLNSPQMVMFLADLSRKTNPAATVVPNSNNPTQAIADEKSSIEKTMRENPRAYYKDEGMQKRYRELLEVEDRM